MQNALRSLARLTGLRFDDQGRATLASPPYAFQVTTPGGGSPRSIDSASSIEPDRHVMTAACRSVHAPADDANAGRFKIFRRYRVLMEAPLADGRIQTWYSPNSYTRDLPPPPEPTSGPLGCECKDGDSGISARFGSSQFIMWLWCPDYYDSAYQHRPFIPDLFQGEGPCILPDRRGILGQWEDHWATVKDGVYRLKEYERGFIEFIENVNRRAMEKLSVRLPANSPPLPSKATSLARLKDDWAAWVAHRQTCAGFIFERLVGHDLWDSFRAQNEALWKEMELALLFDHAPVGAWFRDTGARLSVIRELIEMGVPVFYRWTGQLDSSPEAAFLRPRLALSPSDNPALNAPLVPAAEESQLTPAEPLLSPRRVRWIRPSESLLSADRAGTTSHAHHEDSDSSLSSIEGMDEEAFLMHSDGFEQGFASGVHTLASRMGVAPKELLYPSPTEPAVAYILVKDLQLTSRVDATRGVGARKERISKLVKNVFGDVMCTSQPPSDTVAMSVIQPKDDPNVAALETRITPAEDSRPYSIMLYDVGVVDAEIRALVTAGKLESDKVILEFFLKHHIRFVTGIARPYLSKQDHTAETAVHSSWWVNADKLPVMFEKWRTSATHLLRQRPRVFRAAYARGGIIARIARLLLGLGDYPLMPTSSTRANGCPLPLVANGVVYHYDWLDSDEILALLGHNGPAGNHDLSLWPPLDMFDARYAGVWVSEYESWFTARVGELRTGVRGASKVARGLLSRQEWNDLLQNSALG